MPVDILRLQSEARKGRLVASEAAGIVKHALGVTAPHAQRLVELLDSQSTERGWVRVASTAGTLRE